MSLLPVPKKIWKCKEGEEMRKNDESFAISSEKSRRTLVEMTSCTERREVSTR